MRHIEIIIFVFMDIVPPCMKVVCSYSLSKNSNLSIKISEYSMTF